jgi:hypothetical protein
MRAGAEAGIIQSFPEGGEVVGIEVQPFPNLCDFLVELCQFLAAGALLGLLVTNRKLSSFHEDLLQLLVLNNHLGDLREALKAQLHRRHFLIIKCDSDKMEKMKRLRKLKHPDPLQHLQIERVSLFV